MNWLKSGAEWIGLGIFILCACFGCARCEQVRTQDEILIKQAERQKTP